MRSFDRSDQADQKRRPTARIPSPLLAFGLRRNREPIFGKKPIRMESAGI
jgi:hypothetical protein